MDVVSPRTLAITAAYSSHVAATVMASAAREEAMVKAKVTGLLATDQSATGPRATDVRELVAQDPRVATVTDHEVTASVVAEAGAAAAEVVHVAARRVVTLTRQSTRQTRGTEEAVDSERDCDLFMRLLDAANHLQSNGPRRLSSGCVVWFYD